MTRTPPPSFVSLLRGQQESLLRAARLLTGEWAAAEELVRRTLAWALANWGAIDYEAMPGALLVRQRLISLYLIEQTAVDAAERSRDEVAAPVADTEDSGHRALINQPGDGHAEPTRSTLMTALAGLTRRHRAIVVARYYLSLSAEEIGTVVGGEPEDIEATAVGVLAALQRSTVLRGG